MAHAICSEDWDSVPRLAICGADCTDASERDGPPYCPECVAFLTFHLALCDTCMRLFEENT